MSRLICGSVEEVACSVASNSVVTSCACPDGVCPDGVCPDGGDGLVWASKSRWMVTCSA